MTSSPALKGGAPSEGHPPIPWHYEAEEQPICSVCVRRKMSGGLRSMGGDTLCLPRHEADHGECMVVEPYGGKLHNGLMVGSEAEHLASEAERLPLLKPLVDHIYDAEKIGVGAYSPLSGFMGGGDLQSVLNKSTLENTLPWTIPILLAPGGKENESIVREARPSDLLAIAGLDGRPFAVITVEEKFGLDKKDIAQKTYGTLDRNHPNVGDIEAFGDTAIAGKVKLFRKLDLPSGRFELTPAETRERFKELGWKNVAGYQARNPPHTAHEYLQRVTLEREDIDGIFIHPVVGKLKKGDYKPEVIMRAYEAFVTNYYPSERALLASFSIAMRYAGPKAVLFYAIVRRNYGCSHYIVGRDQAGVGNYYEPFACHQVFDDFDVGVIPLRYRETFYCESCGWMASTKICPHPKENHISTSQTKIRTMLSEGKPLPREILRPEVAKILMDGDVIN